MAHSHRFAVVVLALAWSAFPAQAAPIVGSFEAFDDFLFGMTFELQNDSDAAGIAGTFEDVLLQLNGATAIVFDNEQVASSTSLTDTFDTSTTPFADGLLTFVFTPVGLPSQHYRFAFDTAVDPPIFFEYTADTGSTPVPEPSTLALLPLGMLALLRSRRSARIRCCVPKARPGAGRGDCH